MTIEERKHEKKSSKKKLIPLLVGSIFVVVVISFLGVDFDGIENKWMQVSEEKNIVKKEGYIQNSEFNDGKTTIYGTFGNPLGIFKETITDKEWKFQKGKSIIYTETTIMPKCDSKGSILSVTDYLLMSIDKDYRDCVRWTINRIIELK